MGDTQTAQPIVGAEVDVKLGSILLGIAAGIERVSDRLDSLVREWVYARKGPITVQEQASGQTNTSGVVWLGLGGPAYGRVREVRRIIISGSFISTSSSGTAEVCVIPGSSAAAISSQGEPPAGWVKDFASEIPLVAPYSAGQMRLRHPNHLYIVVLGGGSGVQYVANLDALDLPDEIVRQEVTV